MPYSDFKPVFPEAELAIAKQDLTTCTNRKPFLSIFGR